MFLPANCIHKRASKNFGSLHNWPLFDSAKINERGLKDVNKHCRFRFCVNVELCWQRNWFLMDERSDCSLEMNQQTKCVDERRSSPAFCPNRRYRSRESQADCDSCEWIIRTYESARRIRYNENHAIDFTPAGSGKFD